DKPAAIQDSWIYFPEDQHLFVRISEPSKYGKGMCPEGKTSLAAEIPCTKDDEKWKMTNEVLSNQVKGQLMDLGFFTEDEIIENFVERTRFAYPILDIYFQENLTVIFSFLSRIKNLELIGRTGTFQYLNMDMVLLHGLNCARKIAGLTDKSARELGHDDQWVG
ncbi:MAG: hypothetical protein JSV04_06010, partial [Candidatus Heimdallarchaeota archaeon]